MFGESTLLKYIKVFIEDETKQRVNLEDYYAGSEDSFKLLIPSGIEDGRVVFDRIIYYEVDVIDKDTIFDELRYRARLATKELPVEKHQHLIRQTIYLFAVKTIKRRFLRAFRKGKDFLYFFYKKKLSNLQIKYRMMKILSSIYDKRAKKIEESVWRKLNKAPYGYLMKVVDFFYDISEKLDKLAPKLNERAIVKEKPLTKEEFIASLNLSVVSNVSSIIEKHFGDDVAKRVYAVLLESIGYLTTPAYG